MPALTTIDSFLTMGISLLLLQANKIEFMKTINIKYLYITYIFAQLINSCILFFIKNQLNKFIDHRKLILKTEPSFFSSSSPTQTSEEEEISYNDYDKRELNKVIQTSIFNFILCSVMGLYFKSSHPLITGIINVPKSIFLNPLYIHYILGWNIKRPFSENRIFENKKDDHIASEELQQQISKSDSSKFERKRKDE